MIEIAAVTAAVCEVVSDRILTNGFFGGLHVAAVKMEASYAMNVLAYADAKACSDDFLNRGETEHVVRSPKPYVIASHVHMAFKMPVPQKKLQGKSAREILLVAGYRVLKVFSFPYAYDRLTAVGLVVQSTDHVLYLTGESLSVPAVNAPVVCKAVIRRCVRLNLIKGVVFGEVPEEFAHSVFG